MDFIRSTEDPFIKELLAENIPIWDACATTPFIGELQSGALPRRLFRRYIIQDSVYLKNYARIYGKALYCAETLRDMQLCYDILKFITDEESQVRLDYLAYFGTDDAGIESVRPSAANQRYIDFLMKTAEGNQGPQMLMAALPCMVSYNYIFAKIAALSASSFYSPFIADHAEEEYTEDCLRYLAFAGEKCRGADEGTRRELAALFQRASLLELEVWKEAYEEGEQER